MHRFRFFPVALTPLLLAGCASVALPTGSSTSLQLVHLRNDLSPYEDEVRYDFLEETIFYSEIGNPEYDEVFFEAALLAGELQQLRTTMTRYREGELDLESENDVEFLTLMADEASVALPDLSDRARAVFERVRALEPSRLGIIEMPRAVAGVDQARRNLAVVLDVGPEEVDAILDDYEALKGDLERVGI